MGTWITNRVHIPERELRNADNLFIPAHNFATLNRIPIFKFPAIWNTTDLDKNKPIQHWFLKNLKSQLLSLI
jgi:hypothetical protein